VARVRITGPAIIFVGLNWQQASLSRPANVRVFTPDAGAIASQPSVTATSLHTVGRRA